MTLEFTKTEWSFLLIPLKCNVYQPDILLLSNIKRRETHPSDLSGQLPSRSSTRLLVSPTLPSGETISSIRSVSKPDKIVVEKDGRVGGGGEREAGYRRRGGERELN